LTFNWKYCWKSQIFTLCIYSVDANCIYSFVLVLTFNFFNIDLCIGLWIWFFWIDPWKDCRKIVERVRSSQLASIFVLAFEFDFFELILDANCIYSFVLVLTFNFLILTFVLAFEFDFFELILEKIVERLSKELVRWRWHSHRKNVFFLSWRWRWHSTEQKCILSMLTLTFNWKDCRTIVEIFGSSPCS
jgi:hypothetical protein